MKVKKTTENRILEKLKEWLNNRTSTTWIQIGVVLDKIEELKKIEERTNYSDELSDYDWLNDDEE